MSVKNLFADVSSHQPSSSTYFQALKNAGCKGVVVKLTEGTYYTNPLATEQCKQTTEKGMKLSVYHFARFSSAAGARSEANFFLSAIKARNLPTSTPVINDFEATHASVAALNAFYEPLEAAGYKVIGLYSMRSWFSAGYFTGVRGVKWVAEYGRSSCSIQCDAWQYTGTGSVGGVTTDLSWDYNGVFTTNSATGSSDSNDKREEDNKKTQTDATKLAYCYSFLNFVMSTTYDKWLH